MSEQLDLDELEALEKAATGGTWEVRFVLDDPRYGLMGVALKQDGEHYNFVQISGSGGARSYTEFVYQEKYITDDSEANAAFIVAIRNSAPTLIAATKERDAAVTALVEVRTLLANTNAELRAARLRIEELEEALRQIDRTAEMSAAIMRDNERTSGWTGSERVARAFERLAEKARAARLLNPEKTL